MKRRSWLLVVLVCAQLHAAKVDMKDVRRAVATDEGIRIDAELTNDFVTPHFPIGVTYQIENTTGQPIAVAEKVCDATYDMQSQTITVSIGSEIPNGGVMPRVVVVRPGEKRTFKAGATFSGPSVPRFVQIRVNVLRDAVAFMAVAEHQPLSEKQFDHWLQSNEAIDLNVLPVRYQPAMIARTADASQR